MLETSSAASATNLANAPIFILIPRALVDVACPGARVAVERLVGPRRGVARDAVGVRAIQALLPRLLVLAAAGERHAYKEQDRRPPVKGGVSRRRTGGWFLKVRAPSPNCSPNCLHRLPPP